mmetsp:Transcript_9164/g.22281  ORF Transcript_9164/g.22281 Transcript_9164/m.22281 type:complete len:907 (+) Transcript_9164:332-3052(+)
MASPTIHPTTHKAVLALALCLALGGSITVDGFQTSTRWSTIPSTVASRTQKAHDPLYLFGRNKEDGGESKSKNRSKGSGSGDSGEPAKRKIPFFGRLKRSKEGDNSNETDGSNPQFSGATIVSTILEDAPAATTTTTAADRASRRKSKIKSAPVTPEDLKLMAEKARLEAEKLDAELTLAKIEKLEKQLLRAKKEDSGSTTTTTTTAVADLQYELDVLQAKVRGEKVPVKPGSSNSATSTTTTTTTTTAQPAATSTAPAKSASIAVPTATIETVRTPDPIVEIDNAKVLEAAAIVASGDTGAMNQVRSEDDLEFVPNFMLKILASFVGVRTAPGQDVDKTEFLRRWNMTRNLDYSYFEDKEPPTFTSSDIRRKKVQILEWGASNMTAEAMLVSGIGDEEDEPPLVVTPVMIERADGNATQLAIYSLEHDYYMKIGSEVLGSQPIQELLPEIVMETMSEMSYFGQMYPKCVNKRGENKGDDYVSEEPTAAMIEVITQTILPSVKFSTSSKPYKVPGGYAITGSHKYETGDALIAAIDAEIEKSRPNLGDQLTVLYTPKYGPLENISLAGESIDSLSSMNSLLESTDLEVFADQEPILFIAGPTLVRDTNPLGLVLASILGLATSWYLSVYPFLLNDKIASRIDSDLQLLEANLQPDLSYLTDFSVPLFYCFMGLQLVHEFAHWLTAVSKDVKLSVPVFVPSFITGITSTVTTFKTLPKNKNDMFDIAAAGPLAGVVASSLALVIGAKLTLVSDPATLPELPLEILRQSTLGGAIIDNILPGSLYVPDGAPTAGITIPLHPFAVAGYVSLMINALALLPIGTTDGGRLTMALFDRAEKMSIGTLTLMALLWAGLFGSDLFLFYFSFCLAFQTGNEAPARNEQDPVDFSRVIVALVCYGLAILTLVPVQ